MLTDGRCSVRGSPIHQGTTLNLNQRGGDEHGNNDDNCPGEFDNDEPDNLLVQVQGSKKTVPVTYRSSRSTEQVGCLSFFHTAAGSSKVRWGSGS